MRVEIGDQLLQRFQQLLLVQDEEGVPHGEAGKVSGIHIDVQSRDGLVCQVLIERIAGHQVKPSRITLHERLNGGCPGIPNSDTPDGHLGEPGSNLNFLRTCLDDGKLHQLMTDRDLGAIEIEIVILHHDGHLDFDRVQSVVRIPQRIGDGLLEIQLVGCVLLGLGLDVDRGIRLTQSGDCIVDVALQFLLVVALIEVGILRTLERFVGGVDCIADDALFDDLALGLLDTGLRLNDLLLVGQELLPFLFLLGRELRHEALLNLCLDGFGNHFRFQFTILVQEDVGIVLLEFLQGLIDSRRDGIVQISIVIDVDGNGILIGSLRNLVVLVDGVILGDVIHFVVWHFDGLSDDRIRLLIDDGTGRFGLLGTRQRSCSVDVLQSINHIEIRLRRGDGKLIRSVIFLRSEEVSLGRIDQSGPVVHLQAIASPLRLRSIKRRLRDDLPGIRIGVILLRVVEVGLFIRLLSGEGRHEHILGALIPMECLHVDDPGLDPVEVRSVEIFYGNGDELVIGRVTENERRTRRDGCQDFRIAIRCKEQDRHGVIQVAPPEGQRFPPVFKPEIQRKVDVLFGILPEVDTVQFVCQKRHEFLHCERD